MKFRIVHFSYLFSLLVVFLIFGACAIKRQKESVITYMGHHSYFHGGYGEWLITDDKGNEYNVDGFDVPTGVGTKFVVIYDSLNPYSFSIDCRRPIIYAFEGITKTICWIKDDYLIKPKKSKLIEVYYLYNNELRREFYPIASPLTDTIRLHKGDKFELDYCTGNPRRIILHLDKPVRDSLEPKTPPTKTP